MKEINLKEILHKHIGSPVNEDKQLIAMREACNQAIELCAEEAEPQYEEIEQGQNSWVWLSNYPEIDKQSILKVKDAIK